MDFILGEVLGSKHFMTFLRAQKLVGGKVAAAIVENKILIQTCIALAHSFLVS